MKKYLFLLCFMLLLAACNKDENKSHGPIAINASVKDIDNALLLKNNEQFVLSENEYEDLISLLLTFSHKYMDICKCLPEPYKTTVENIMGGNAIVIEFKEPVPIKLPPNGDTIKTGRILIDTSTNQKTIGYEFKGNFRLYAYQNDISGKLEEIQNKYK
jgi:hypothetical protein